MSNTHPIFFESWLGGLGKHLWFWLGVSLLMLGVVVSFSKFFDTERSFLGVCIPQISAFFGVFLSYKICRHIFRDWMSGVRDFAEFRRSDFSNWLEKSSVFKNDKIIFQAAFAMSIAATLAFGFSDYFAKWTFESKFVALVLICITAFPAGAGLCTLIKVSHFVWMLGRSPEITIQTSPHRYGVLTTGTMLVKCWSLVLLCWLLYTLSALYGLPSDDVHTNDSGFPAAIVSWLTSFPVILLAYPTFPVIVGTFVVCQYPLHTKMYDYKQNKIAAADNMISKITPLSEAELTSDTIEKIQFLKKEREEYLSLPVWPFCIRYFFVISISSATPLATVFYNAFPPVELLNKFFVAP